MRCAHPAASRTRPDAVRKALSWKREFIGTGRLGIRALLEKPEIKLAEGLRTGGGVELSRIGARKTV